MTTRNGIRASLRAWRAVAQPRDARSRSEARPRAPDRRRARLLRRPDRFRTARRPAAKCSRPPSSAAGSTRRGDVADDRADSTASERSQYDGERPAPGVAVQPARLRSVASISQGELTLPAASLMPAAAWPGMRPTRATPNASAVTSCKRESVTLSGATSEDGSLERPQHDRRWPTRTPAVAPARSRRA